MEAIRRNPFFYTLLFVLVAVGLAGIWYLAQVTGRLGELKRAYDTKSAQYDRYLAARPSPTEANLEALQNNYIELYELYEQTMATLNLNTFDRDAFFGRTPVSRADWSFVIHKYKENARYEALSAGISLPQNVQFGLADLTDAVPTADQAKNVHEQIVIMTSLLEKLFESGIQSFVRIQRGRPLQARGSGPVSRRSSDRLYNEGDVFIVNPSTSLVIPDTVSAYTFRVAFSGQSIALRSFLNRIADSSLPLVIRGVEVDLSSEGGAKEGLESIQENPLAAEARSDFAANTVPIISDNTSLFVVTVEFLDLLVEVEPPSRTAAAQTEGEDGV